MTGHGFGLPHWDENFFNRNMGNCMDYTSKPKSNAQPDESNFNFLKELYGEVGGTVPPSSKPIGSSPAAGSAVWGIGNGEGRRGLRALQHQPRPPIEPSQEVMDNFYKALREFDQPKTDGGDNRWRYLQEQDGAEVYEFGLGGPFVARVLLLRA